MEDRHSPHLYLELWRGSGDTGRSRAEDLAAMPHAGRVTWWANCAFERTDLPRRIEDGSTLVVVEPDEGFVCPDRPEGATEAHLFGRTPRPSQGILTDGPTLGLMIVWIGPRTPDLARDLRDWGDFVHIRHIAAAGIPGFTQISVYENAASADPQYMHFYEFDNPDAEGTFSQMIDHVAPRLGGLDTEAYAAWADWRPPGGRLFYCTTFTRLGALSANDA